MPGFAGVHEAPAHMVAGTAIEVIRIRDVIPGTDAVAPGRINLVDEDVDNIAGHVHGRRR